MAKPKKAPGRWREVPIDSVTVDAAWPGWTYDDPVTALKLQASLRRHGQFRPVIVVSDGAGGSLVALSGRRLLMAMRAVGLSAVTVCDLGLITMDATCLVTLAEALRFETDFAKVSQAVHGMLSAGGATREQLASAGPWPQDRIGYLDTLATFDWSQFAEAADGQAAMDWDDLPADLPTEPGLEAPVGADDGGEAAELLRLDMPDDKALPVVDAAPAATTAPAVASAPVVPPPRQGKRKAPAPQGPSLFDDDEVAV